MKKIAVLYIIHTLEKGGAERLLLSTIREINKILNVNVCSMYGKDDLIQLFSMENIHVFRLNWRNKFNPLMIFELIRVFRKTRPDIVHTHLFFASFYGGIVAWIFRIPFLTTEHNISNWENKNLMVLIANRFISNLCSQRIAVSEAVKSAIIQRNGIHKSKIKVIRNCIDIKEFRKSNKIENYNRINEFTVGSIGRLEDRKGYDILLRAIANLNSMGISIKCLLVGEGKDEKKLKLLATALGIRNIVEFVGSQLEVSLYIQKLDVFILPSRSEGFGIAILEAMAVGCPVIASKVGGISEIITHEVNGLLVPVEDIHALAKSILRLRNFQFSKLLVQNAYKTVKKNYSATTYSKKLIKEYKSLVPIQCIF